MRHSRITAAACLLCTCSLLAAGCATTRTTAEDPEVSALASKTLRRFRDMAEFEDYRDRVRAVVRSRGVDWSVFAQGAADGFLLAQKAEEPCDPAVMECEEERAYSSVAVTGSRVTAAPTSITNNQESGVDEGDIVKQFGRFLIVLQDGRLFSIDMGSRRGELRLVDRIDLYPTPEADTWYDELLIHGNTLVVIGYNYGEDASEIDVVAIDDSGALKLLSRYFLESEDYYSGANYASRLVRGQLVLYTPVDISSRGPLAIPRIRRWTADAGFGEWQPLFQITDVYLPIQQTLTPMLHVVSMCSIGQGEQFGCKSRGVVGPAYHEFYVSSEHAYLWLTSDYPDWGFGGNWPGGCPEGIDLYGQEPLSAAVFQLPFKLDTVRAVHAIGAPYDQFAFDERNDRLLALLVRQPAACHLQDTVPLVFASIPLSFFGPSPMTLQQWNFARMPAAKGYGIQSRYTRDYLVYAGSPSYWRYVRRHEQAELVAVPLGNPTQVSHLYPRHSIQRLEVIGENAIGFGNLGQSDLGISTLELRRARPLIADTGALAGVQESEGRSHAFNSIIAPDGSGMFGLPTVYRSKLEHDWDAPSDVQFFTLNERLAIASIGELAGVEYAEDDGYECEVSCFDWYGNARPIFVGGRIYALTGNEIVEGEVRNGIIVEIARLRMTGLPALRH